MEYVQIGDSGLKVSRVCLGTLTFGDKAWREYMLDVEQSRPIIERALDLGINFFDTADMYSLGASEEIVGRVLGELTRRSDVVLATKVYFPMSNDPNDRGLSRKHILEAVDASLKRLDTEYIDLYQVHRWDYETPIEETLETLNDLVRMGKVRYIGASSMFSWQFAKALYTADVHGWSRFISMQNHYNLVYREEEREMLPLCRAEGIGVVPWSPLARGFLAGNRQRLGGGETVRARHDTLANEMYFREVDFDIVQRVVDLAERIGCRPAQVALAWLLHKPGITAPIVGVRNIDHLDDAVESLKIELSENDLAYLEELYVPHPIIGHE